MHLRQAADHALAADVVGQAAKRLGADDVLVAVFRQLQHLRREQPALAHLAAVADDALDERLGVLEAGGGNKVRAGRDGLDEHALHPLHKAQQEGAEELFHRVAAVELHVLDAVVDLEQREAEDAGNHVLAVLRAQKCLEPVVAQRGILDVDFADDADARLFFVAALDGGEVRDDAVKVFAHLSAAESTSLIELSNQLVVPVINERVRLAFFELIRPGLVGDVHDAVAVDQRRHDLTDERQRELEAGGAFQTAHVDGDDRNLREPGLFERLAQQVDVVAGAAAAAGLRDGERDAVQVVFAGVQRVDELANDQQRGHAGVVVNVLEALALDVRAAVVEHLHVIAVQAQHFFQQGKVEFQHVGHEDGVAGLAHFTGKLDMLAGHGLTPFRRRCQAPPADRWRQRASAGGCAPRRGW